MKLKLRKDMNLVLEKVWTVKGWEHFRRTALNSTVDIFAVRWNVRWGIWLVCRAVTHQVGNPLECFLFAPMAQLCLLVTPKLVWEDVDAAWQLRARPAPTSYKAWATRHIYIIRYIYIICIYVIYYIFWIYTSAYVHALVCTHPGQTYVHVDVKYVHTKRKKVGATEFFVWFPWLQRPDNEYS